MSNVRRRRRPWGQFCAAVLVAGLVALGGVSAPASAVEPLELRDQITDRPGVLGADRPAVSRALDRFYGRTGLRLYVVYVRSFDDLSPQQWSRATAKESGLGRHDVLLVFAQKDRAFGHTAPSRDLAPDALNRIDETRIEPALRNDDYAKATIAAAAAYGDLAVDAGLPWGWIVSGLAVLGLLLWLLVLRTRRRFDHTHHVLDEHGHPVDPAQILTLDEIEATSAAALVAVDDAVLTAIDDVQRAAEQLGGARAAQFSQAVDQARTDVNEAFRHRHKFDKLIDGAGLGRGTRDDDTERKLRKRASRIISLCERADASLDTHTDDFDEARNLRRTAENRLASLAEQVDAVGRELQPAREHFALLPGRAAWAVTGHVELAGNLLAAAEAQLQRDGHDETRVRIIEDATSTATRLLAAVRTRGDGTDDPDEPDAAQAVADVELFVASRRGAVGVVARTLRAEARRHLALAAITDDPERQAARLRSAAADARAALAAAIADVARWQAGRDAHDMRYGRKFDALVLAGVLVDETDSGGLRAFLGGSSHGGGSGAPYRGNESGGTQRTAGRFGGTTTRGRHGGFSFGGSAVRMTP